jgi:hypothetical protein
MVGSTVFKAKELHWTRQLPVRLLAMETDYLRRNVNLLRMKRSRNVNNNKKFWKELICLLSLHYLTMLYERPSF